MITNTRAPQSLSGRIELQRKSDGRDGDQLSCSTLTQIPASGRFTSWEYFTICMQGTWTTYTCAATHSNASMLQL